MRKPKIHKACGRYIGTGDPLACNCKTTNLMDHHCIGAGCVFCLRKRELENVARRRDKNRIDHAPYPGCSACQAKTGEAHFVGCTYKGPTEREILAHYRRRMR